ncbi:MAG TPA: hypothetical protein VF142_11375 [Longimicrobium sp.]
MHAHLFAIQERMQAPSQILRGVAGSCAPMADVAAVFAGLRGSCPAPRQDACVGASSPSTTAWKRGWDDDFGSSAGGPV